MSSNGSEPQPYKHTVHIAHDKFVVDGMDLSSHVSGFSLVVDPSQNMQALHVQMIPDFEFNGELNDVVLYMQCDGNHDVQPDA